MNSISRIFTNNSLTTTTEPWFIPLDILNILCVTCAVLLATIFLLIILLDKRCHTVPMMLIANINFTALASGSNIIAMTAFTLQNDLQQIQNGDFKCIFHRFLSYVLCATHSYSYLLQAIYQHISIIHPARLFWRSARTQLCLIGFSWIVAFVYPIPYLFLRTIVYNVDNQICQVPMEFSFSLVYTPFIVYIIPVSLVMLIYLKIVHHVKEISTRTTVANTQHRTQRFSNGPPNRCSDYIFSSSSSSMKTK